MVKRIALMLISLSAWGQIPISPATRTELGADEVTELIDLARQMDKLRDQVQALGTRMQNRLASLKTAHNAENCEGLSNSFLWQNCQPPKIVAPTKKGKSK